MKLKAQLTLIKLQDRMQKDCSGNKTLHQVLLILTRRLHSQLYFARDATASRIMGKSCQHILYKLQFTLACILLTNSFFIVAVCLCLSHKTLNC